MNCPAIVWDQPDDPPDTTEKVLCWQSYVHGGPFSSVPRYLEEHAERFRSKYLAFIHELGEQEIKGRRVVEHLDTGDGFSLWWMTHLAEKSPLKSPRIYDCLRLLALEEMLLAAKPSELALCSPDRQLAEAMQQMCRQLSISFVWRRQKQRISRRRRDFFPYPLQGLLLGLRDILQRWSLRRLQKPRWFSGQKAVFLCSYFIHLDAESCARGVYASRLWGILPQFLHDNGFDSDWIEHYLPNPAVPDTNAGLDLLRRLNGDADQQGFHVFLDTYLTWGLCVRAMKEWVRLGVRARRLKGIRAAFYAEGSVAWLWPLLREDWSVSVYGHVAMCNCLWVELFDVILKEMPYQRLGLYIWENQGWEHALLHAWRKNGHGEIVGVQHATVAFWHLYNFDDPRSLAMQGPCSKPLPDRLGVNGMAAWRAFEMAGYPMGRLVELEALRYLDLTGMRSLTAKPHMQRPVVSGDPEPRVLVLGDWTPASTQSLLELLQSTVALLSFSCRFVFKPHPGYQPDLAGYPGLRLEMTTKGLHQILDDFDVALSANGTSAAVDAYMVGLPIIIESDGAGLNLNPLRGQNDVHFVSSPEELAVALREAGRQGATWRENNLFFLDPELPRWKSLLEAKQKTG